MAMSQLPEMCANLADIRSCETMVRMAKRESMRNFQNYMFTGSTPACEMFTHLADRELEMSLLAGNGLSRKICFNPDSLSKQGSWESQFLLNRPVPDKFNAVTKPK